MCEKLTKVLISTIYNPEPVLYACNKTSPEKLILLTTDKKDNTTKKAVKLIQESLGLVIKIEIETIPEYDIVEIAKKTVSLIDAQEKDDQITINITSGRKTQSIGVIYASYARSKYIEKINYYPEEKNQIIQLPIMNYKLTESQTKILKQLTKKNLSYAQLATKTKLSTAMVYRAIEELQNQSLTERQENGKLKITDAGKIAGL